MKKHFFFLLLAWITTLPLSFSDFSQAQELYKKAMDLMKQDHKGNAGETLQYLKACREHYLSAPSLSEDEEAMLMKINSHIYWQSKFSTSSQIKSSSKKIASNKKKSPAQGQTTSKKVEDLALKKIKAEKKEVFNESLKEAKNYEEKHPKDALSNMLHYLELQLKVVDAKEGTKLLDKTDHYNTQLINEKSSIIKKITQSIPRFEEEHKAKNYDALKRDLFRAYKLSNLSAKERSVLKIYIMEMDAMSTIKKRLIDLDDSKAMQLPHIYGGIKGVVIKVDEEGLHYLSETRQRSLLKWSMTSDAILLGLSHYVFDENDSNDLVALALANLKLKNYNKAYSLFNRIMTLAPKNYLKYRDFLSICETGFRLKYGPNIEKLFLSIESEHNSGNTHKARDLLVQLKQDYLNKELGKSYLPRFRLSQREVIGL